MSEWVSLLFVVVCLVQGPFSFPLICFSHSICFCISCSRSFSASCENNNNTWWACDHDVSAITSSSTHVLLHLADEEGDLLHECLQLQLIAVFFLLQAQRSIEREEIVDLSRQLQHDPTINYTINYTTSLCIYRFKLYSSLTLYNLHSIQTRNN